ncbi:site-specific integrase, partial [Brevundimonas sp. A19_0]|uniref:site-specific integrase n=1 Tax=Brevundimonas sp. A19_0 TaxID=2821087 RepID=UPI001ADCF846
YYLRLRVPRSLAGMIGKTHVVKTLSTGYRAEAVRRARIVAAELEQEWRYVETQGAGPAIADPHREARPAVFSPTTSGDKTLRQAFELFRSDPAKQRTRKTDLHYLNLIELAVCLWGENRTIRSIDREASRELLDVLVWLPSNAEKRFPKLSPLAAAQMAKERGLVGRLSPASVNGYMTKFRAVMNFCQNEGWIERNPAKGLQVIDRVRRRDKRLPFSPDQLRLIFDAPLYRGCVDDWAGYSTPGHARPRRGRFWVPLIALFSGMRMNEICQLHVADIHRLDGVDCFFVTEGPSDSDTGKRLKTAASERFVPVHPTLIKIGFMTFVTQRRAAGAVRLFSELQKSSTGYYSDPFSKWFRRFLERCGAARERTCFHSFRHCYRDALREARIEHELALALGGWSSGVGNEGGETAAAYGRGYRAQTLYEAIGRIAYTELDLSHLFEPTPHRR